MLGPAAWQLGRAVRCGLGSRAWWLFWLGSRMKGALQTGGEQVVGAGRRGAGEAHESKPMRAEGVSSCTKDICTYMHECMSTLHERAQVALAADRKTEEGLKESTKYFQAGGACWAPLRALRCVELSSAAQPARWQAASGAARGCRARWISSAHAVLSSSLLV